MAAFIPPLWSDLRRGSKLHAPSELLHGSVKEGNGQGSVELGTSASYLLFGGKNLLIPATLSPVAFRSGGTLTQSGPILCPTGFNNVTLTNENNNGDNGFYPSLFQVSRDNPYISDQMDAFAVDYFPYHTEEHGGVLTGDTVSYLPISVAHLGVDGYHVHHYGDDWYYRVHISPNPVDVGSVLSAQSHAIEVWNAWLTPSLLSSLVSDGADGLTLTGPVAEPTTFQANEFRVYTLVVSLDGPATINAGFTFYFPSQTTRLAMTGLRVVVFPIAPNWVNPVVERLEWFTEVLEMRDGSEQRIRHRQNPRQSVEFEILAIGDVANRVGNLLFSWLGRQWGLPLWFHMQQITVSASGNTVTCPTAGYEFQVGGYLFLYTSVESYETAQIASITGSTLTTVLPLTSTWLPGTWVMPLRFSRVKDDITLSHINGEVTTGIVRFHSEQTLAVTSTAWPTTYLGLPVLETEPNRVSNMTEQWSRRVSEIDAGVGQSYRVDQGSYSKAVRAHEFVALNRAQITAHRNLLYYMQGRWKEFWSPTFNRDIRVVEDVLVGQTWLTVKSMQYTSLVDVNAMRKHVRIRLMTGQVYYRAITAADDLNTPAGTEKLTLDSSLPVAFPAGYAVVSFMTLCRSDADTVEINWRTPTVADTTSQLKGVIA